MFPFCSLTFQDAEHEEGGGAEEEEEEVQGGERERDSICQPAVGREGETHRGFQPSQMFVFTHTFPPLSPVVENVSIAVKLIPSDFFSEPFVTPLLK